MELTVWHESGNIRCMILALVKISPDPVKRQELIHILLTVKGPALATSGCRSCSVYEEYDETAIVYLELWDTEAELRQHIRSPLYSRLLEAMELSINAPEINYYTVTKAGGIDLIGEVRESNIV